MVATSANTKEIKDLIQEVQFFKAKTRNDAFNIFLPSCLGI
jgi:hypothetical protein